MAVRFEPSKTGRAALPALILFLLSISAFAGSYQIYPLLVNLPGRKKIVTYTVHNTSQNAINIQINAFRWTQSNNTNHLSKAPELMVIPRIITIPPGGDQLVRVALQGARPTSELDYRLHFRQISGPSKDNKFFGVRATINMNLPLFFQPRDPTRRFNLSVKREKSDTRAVVTVRNEGKVFLRITNLLLINRHGQIVGKQEKPVYVLPGATRRWSLSAKKGFARSLADVVKLKAFTSQGQKEYLLRKP